MIIASFYFIGYVVSYVLVRKFILEGSAPSEWTIEDRIKCLLVSILSWGTALYTLYLMLIQWAKDKPAKW